MSDSQFDISDAPTLDDTDDGLTRRTVLRSALLAGLGVGAAGKIPTTASARPDDGLGWVTSHSTQTADPLLRFTPEESFSESRYNGFYLATSHCLEYLGAQWVRFGDPDDGLGGAWKHTFVVTGFGASIYDQSYPGNPDPDRELQTRGRFVQTSVGARRAPGSDGIAISERRDDDLTGFTPYGLMTSFLNSDVELEDGGSVTLAEILRAKIANGPGEAFSEDLYQVAHDPNAWANQLDARNDFLLGAAGFGLGLLFIGAGFGVGFAIAVPFLLAELLSDTEYQPPPVGFDDGFRFEYGQGDPRDIGYPGAAHFATFDVYVSPEASAQQFDVSSHHRVKTEFYDRPRSFDDKRMQHIHGFYPRPTWTIEVDGLPHPDDLSADDDPSNARIVTSNVSGYTRLQNESVDPPVAEIDPFLRQPTTDVPVEFDGSDSRVADADAGDIVEYRWSLERFDGPLPQPSGDGPWSTADSFSLQLPAGEYSVDLTVQDSLGNQSSTHRSFTVTERPTAAFEVVGDLATETVTLDASGSEDPDGEVVTYQWQIKRLFEGNRPPIRNRPNTYSGETLDYEFPTGTYEVELTVFDDAGAWDTVERTLEVAGGGGPSGSPGNGGGGNGGGRGNGGGPATGGGSGWGL